MNAHYLTIGAVVLGVAVLSYIFIPGIAKPDKWNTQTSQATATRVQQDKPKTVATHTKPVKRNTAMKKTRHKRVAEARIESETTLRKEELYHRSGPPSKMYGSL